MDYLERFYVRAFDWLLVLGPRVLAALFLLISGLWLIRLLNNWMKRLLERRHIDPTLRGFLLNFLITGMRILLIIFCMQMVGIKMTLFVSIITAFGVAIGLALSGTMQNFASGILILLLKPYRVGDTIFAQNQTGIVSSIQLFYTVVITFDNRTVIFPNSKLSNEVIINLSRQGERRLDIELIVSNTIPFPDVKHKILDVLGSCNELLTEPVQRIGISSIEADKYKVMVSAWTQAHGYEDTKLKLQEMLMKAKVHLADPAA